MADKIWHIAHLIHSMYVLYVRRAVQIWLPYNGPDLRCVFVCLPLYKNLHIIISSKHTISATEASSDVLNRVGGQLSAHSGNIVLQIIRTLMISEDIPLPHPAPQRFVPTTSHKNSWHYFVLWLHNWMPLLTSICKAYLLYHILLCIHSCVIPPLEPYVGSSTHCHVRFWGSWTHLHYFTLLTCMCVNYQWTCQNTTHRQRLKAFLAT